MANRSNPTQTQLPLVLDSEGIEPESPGEPAEPHPWDPDSIRVDPKMFSLKNVYDWIEDGTIDIAPDFQRSLVWTDIQMTKLIESILLRIPLPTFYFAADNDGQMKVVDGVQRLTTIRDFVGDRFSLSRKGLQYLSQVAGQSFKDLEPSWRRRIFQTQLVVNVIEASARPEVQFEIFQRINTGGEPLNAQEIRHCIMKNEVRALLKRMASKPSFLGVIPESLQHSRRMLDRELVLRFLAFSLPDAMQTYVDIGQSDSFLNDAARRLGEMSASELASLEQRFDSAMANAKIVFGDQAFRKPSNGSRLNSLNRPLFDSWSVILAPYSVESLHQNRGCIVARFHAALEEHDYDDAISVATSDTEKVKLRFAVASSILRECVT